MFSVAMELVEGQSLREWLAAAPRTRREILDAFLQAGQGLAAAHDAAMTHRDFKLDNVLVGKDGRVRVSDFGLARSLSGESDPRAAPLDDLGPLVSRDGSLSGTPAYMAPAQLHGGDPADARSDQFSFCAALYEALYGATPFAGTTLLALVAEMEDGRLRPPPANSTVPGWLRAIVARGLRASADERYPTMRDLLAALAKDPAALRRRRAFVAVAVVVAALAGGRRALPARRGARVPRAGAPTRWRLGRRRAARGARGLRRHGPPLRRGLVRPHGARPRRLRQRMDAPGRRRVRRATDERAGRARPAARRVSRGPAEPILRAFVGVLSHADGETVDRAVQAARALPALDDCAGKDPLRGHAVPSDPALRADVSAVEEQMKIADARRTAGRFTVATALATKSVASAERLGFGPLTAQALLALAKVHDEAAEPDAAEPLHHRATVAAEASGATRVEAFGWIGLAHRSAEKGEYDRADQAVLTDHARKALLVERVGDDEHPARQADADARGAPSATRGSTTRRASCRPEGARHLRAHRRRRGGRRLRRARRGSTPTCRAELRRGAKLLRAGARSGPEQIFGPDHPEGGERAETTSA